MIIGEELGQDTRPIKSPRPGSPGNQKNDQKKRREETRRERNPKMILNIKVFTREFMHYVLQEKICNTVNPPKISPPLKLHPWGPGPKISPREFLDPLIRGY